jgi:D-arabinose 1-dehydrogenase-like Zn-dependent alcohol dehydrogenase
MVRAAGAGEVVDPSAGDALKSLLKSTGGGVAAAIDFVGATATFQFGFSALRRTGRLINVGLFGGAPTLVPVMLSMKSLSVIGSYVGSLQEMRELVALAQGGTLPGMPLATQPLATATEALADLRAARVRGRVILKP